MTPDQLEAVRQGAAHDRIALLDELATGDTIGRRRAALRVWGSSGRLLARLDPTRNAHACRTARRWIGWAEALLIRGEVDPGLAVAEQHHAGTVLAERKPDDCR